MTDLDALRVRAVAVRLHGLVAHWSEVATEALGRAAARLGGATMRQPRSKSSAADRPWTKPLSR
jgi:hypothetical protein